LKSKRRRPKHRRPQVRRRPAIQLHLHAPSFRCRRRRHYRMLCNILAPWPPPPPLLARARPPECISRVVTIHNISDEMRNAAPPRSHRRETLTVVSQSAGLSAAAPCAGDVVIFSASAPLAHAQCLL